jgi:mRNA interferase MazF
MIYNPFSVIVIPFPFINDPQAKYRPAIVLSTEAHQQQTGHITVLMATSARHSPWRGDHMLVDLATAGLQTPTIVRQKLFTIDARLVKRQVGHLSSLDREGVMRHLRNHAFEQTQYSNNTAAAIS